MALLQSQIRIGNFKKAKDDRGHKNSTARDDREGMDDKHLANLRLCPCIVRGCSHMPAGQAHHLRHGAAKSERGAGMKATDQTALPLCADHHVAGVDNVHKVGSKAEAKWFKSHGIEHPLQAAKDLWGSRGDLPKMIKITMAYKTDRPSTHRGSGK